MRPFGMTADGRPVEAVLLRWPGGLEAEVIAYGAILHRLRFPAPEGPREALLHQPNLEAYERDTAYMNALVGRVANRIGGGRFPLDGREVQVGVNDGPNTLHGGPVGFSKRLWRVEDVAADNRSAVLAYTSPDGEDGFPGAAEVRARYALVAPDTLEIAYEATVTAPTPLNLSQHCYFNLSGRAGSTIEDHRLTIHADRYTPVDGPGMIPTGAVASVEGTPLDLRGGAVIGEVLARPDAQMRWAGGLDFNWALPPSTGAPALRLEAADGASLELVTDQRGVQAYSGHKLQPPFVRHGALAVEPQGFPDAPNHPDFPSVVVRPGEAWTRRSLYRLRAG